MCTFIGIGIRGDVAVETVWPFEGRFEPTSPHGSGVRSLAEGWRFYELVASHCHCGSPFGQAPNRAAVDDPPTGWEEWAEERRADWLRLTEDVRASAKGRMARLDDDLADWARDLRTLLAAPGVTGVGLFHSWGAHLLEWPIDSERRESGDLATALGDLPEDVFLWIGR